MRWTGQTSQKDPLSHLTNAIFPLTSMRCTRKIEWFSTQIVDNSLSRLEFANFHATSQDHASQILALSSILTRPKHQCRSVQIYDTEKSVLTNLYRNKRITHHQFLASVYAKFWLHRFYIALVNTRRHQEQTQATFNRKNFCITIELHI